jgi:hypothetical protein
MLQKPLLSGAHSLEAALVLGVGYVEHSAPTRDGDASDFALKVKPKFSHFHARTSIARARVWHAPNATHDVERATWIVLNKATRNAICLGRFERLETFEIVTTHT